MKAYLTDADTDTSYYLAYLYINVEEGLNASRNLNKKRVDRHSKYLSTKKISQIHSLNQNFYCEKCYNCYIRRYIFNINLLDEGGFYMETTYKIYDCIGEEIFIGDVVKSVTQTDKDTVVKFYLYGLSDNNTTYLFMLDSSGNIERSEMLHSHIGQGISLVNDDTCKWYRVGKKEELPSEIFEQAR